MRNMGGTSAIFLCCLIVAVSPVASRMAAGVVSPPLLVFLAAATASLLFVPWLFKNKQWGALFDKKNALKFLAIGTFGTALPFTVSLFALKYTTPLNAAVMQQTEMLYSLVFAYFLLGERPGARQLLGSALVITGITLVLIKDGFNINLRGDLLIVCSTWTLQLGSSIAKKLTKDASHQLITAARNFYAIPVLLLALLAFRDSFFIKPGLTFWGVFIYMAVFKYILAMFFWYIALKKLDLAKITAVYLSYPALSFVLSLMLGFDVFSWQKTAGLAIVMAGVYMVSSVFNKGEAK